jgi:hypothetical protein
MTTPEEESELSLQDVVGFLAEHGRSLLMGAVAGLLVALSGWWALGKYSAESILINNEVEALLAPGQIKSDPNKTDLKPRAVSFLTWRSLSRSLPGLASQWVDEGRFQEAALPQMRTMANPQWWGSGVKPTFSLTKADTKDLAVLSKSMQESGSADILNWVVTARGKSPEQAQHNAQVATDFIMQGAAYLSVREILSGYESQMLTTESEQQKRVLDTEVELKYLRARASNLEALRKQFPGNAAGSQQVVDLRDSNAKYMPIVTQIIAVQAEIHEAQERLARMRDKLAQTAWMRRFVLQALASSAQARDGLSWIGQLLEMVSALRTQAPNDDANAQLVLNTVHADLVRTRTYFTKGLETRLAPSVTPPAVAPALGGGLAGGAVLTLLWLLLRKLLRSVRERQQRPAS